MRAWASLTALALLGLVPAVPAASDVETEFAPGTTIVGVQVGGGAQNNVEGERTISDLSFLSVMSRLSYLPIAPFGAGWLRSALEPGLEGWLQYYRKPGAPSAQGLKAALRYHWLGVGPLVPYLEVTAGAGGTNLKVSEIRSPFTFVLEGGAGASWFCAPGVAVNLGYRVQHVSNGNTSRPNRGFESNIAILGVSYHFR